MRRNGDEIDASSFTFEVEANGLRIEVAVLLHLQPCVLHDGDVVSPGGVWHVDRGPLASEPSKHFSHDPASSCSGESLLR